MIIDDLEGTKLTFVIKSRGDVFSSKFAACSEQLRECTMNKRKKKYSRHTIVHSCSTM